MGTRKYGSSGYEHGRADGCALQTSANDNADVTRSRPTPPPPGRTPCIGRAHGVAAVLYRDRERTITPKGEVTSFTHVIVTSLYVGVKLLRTTRPRATEGATQSRFAAFVAFESKRKRGSWGDCRTLHELCRMPMENQENIPTPEHRTSLDPHGTVPVYISVFLFCFFNHCTRDNVRCAVGK